MIKLTSELKQQIEQSNIPVVYMTLEEFQQSIKGEYIKTVNVLPTVGE